MREAPKLDLVSRCLFVLISVVVAAVGACALITEYSPAVSTRFGMTQPLFGRSAQAFGVIMLLLALLPLLPFCKSARQAAILGTVLGVVLIAVVFYTVYAR